MDVNLGAAGMCSVCSAMEPDYSSDFQTATLFKWEENLTQLCTWPELLIFPSYTSIFYLSPFEYKAMEITYPKKRGPLPLSPAAKF